MPRWFFEPGHTAAGFRARHMMVTWVRGHFKDVHGTLEFDPENPRTASVEDVIDARKIWTGEPDRDKHLMSADFLDVENYPTITFKGNLVELCGADEAKLQGDLTIRGVTRPITFDVRSLQAMADAGGRRRDKGPRRAGFCRDHRINRQTRRQLNGVPGGGIVVGTKGITVDAERSWRAEAIS
jgi:polyisoprenoid-binding protein YceI